MVKERLAELQKFCDHAPHNDHQQTTLTIERRPIDDEIESVLQEYSNLRDGIADIKANVRKMRDLLTEITSSLGNSTILPEKMNTVREQNMSLCQKMFSQMKQLEINLPASEDYTLVARIKRTNYHCIRDDFMAAWREHEDFLVYYEDRLTKSLIRQAKITNTNITEEEAESLISNHTTSMFVGNILEETEAARQNLRELLTRHSELTKLERSLTEVRDMFVRISALVMEQSSLVQVVEYHAQQATFNVDRGNEQLEKARDYKMKWLKRKSCLLIWLCVGLFVVVVVLFALD